MQLQLGDTIFDRWQRRHPAEAAAFMLGVYHGPVMIAREIIEGQAYSGKWPSYTYGGGFALPVLGAAGAIALRDRQPDPGTYLFDHPDFHWMLFKLGAAISVGLEVHALIMGRSFKEATLASQLAHAGFFPVVFAIVFGSIGPLIVAKGHPIARALAALALLCYFITWVMKPSPRGGRPEYD